MIFFGNEYYLFYSIFYLLKFILFRGSLINSNLNRIDEEENEMYLATNRYKRACVDD